MRDIEFRGQRADTGKWVFGSFHKDRNGEYLIVENSEIGLIWYKVNKKTIGQYAGLKDKNGVKIFEGDIVKVERSFILGKTLIGIIIWEDGGLLFYYKNPFHGGCGLSGLIVLQEAEVIGNIHDNPDLFEENNAV